MKRLIGKFAQSNSKNRSLKRVKAAICTKVEEVPDRTIMSSNSIILEVADADLWACVVI